MPDDIAATLKLEAQQLAAYGKNDPILASQAARLELLAFWAVPADIAATLKLEAKQLAAYGKDDLILASQASRLELLAERLCSSELPLRQQSATVDPDMQVQPQNAMARSHQKTSCPEIDTLTDAGWSMRRLSEALTKSGYKISYTYLGKLLRLGPSPELKRAIRETTKIRL